MTILRIYDVGDVNKPIKVTEACKVTEDSAEIAVLLNEKGVRFEHWPTRELAKGVSQDDILSVYEDEISRLKSECGFTTADVVSLTPAHPDREVFRQKFLNEHRHVEDEVRFFVGGQGLFYLHLESKVYVVLCQQNDLISVPDGTPHWFDMGSAPEFTCIRLFSNPEGWVAEFTGDSIASRFPRYEALVG